MMAVIAVFLTWRLAPAKLHRAGKSLISDYVASGNATSSNALKSLSEGNPSDAEKLLEDWVVIGVDDRYYRHKRKILLSLSEHYLETREYRKSVDFITPSLQENSRDIMLFIEWAKSALHIPDLQQDAEDRLKVMAQRFPDHVQLNTLYIRGVLHKGDEAAAIEALSKIKKLTPKTGGWSVLWKIAPKAKYNKRAWPKLKKEGDRWSLNTLIPNGTTTLRIDPPPNVRLDILNIRIISGNNSMWYSLSDVLEINMMQRKGNSLSAQGQDNPYFVIPAPKWLSASSPTEAQDVKVIFDITNVKLGG